ncbi:malignant fibrous histiocytoma-amplified sequence 1 homolog [Actinia tenebrosa]|uniref:Malignant fibrous histiocytoma-amplified sequence 1 homolog n=1 Tax=Actinia tenebrosa TaxID=6105 RepID=A0A6P8I5J8_ACTTE|nr:malignant fibrous histiocytoma-amplified sequence 1 homolog [Actinia tenebrosa]XP_031560253.1 malignant fibrous histiocytoma-amplified sequence 1 homolog [Actinia tenebrosa]
MQESYQEVQNFLSMAKEDDEGGLALDLTQESYKVFPFAILELKDLRTLRLNFSNLSSIPTSISRLINLKVLELKSNDFKKFPLALCELTNLELLDLSDNEIVTIPSEITKLKSLKTLKLRNTKLKGILSEYISALTSLEYLDVSKNALNAFPESFANLKELERLNIWQNSFAKAPSILIGLTKLKILDISYNKLEVFDLDLFTSGIKVEDLDLEGNELTTFPEKVCSLDSLQRLDVGRNKISDIPEDIKNLRKLEELWINNNNLNAFPKVICKLLSLETFSISYNNIKAVPNELAYLSELKNLELDHCGLDVMPLSICMLKNLKRLSLGGNNIQKIPIVVNSLHELLFINLIGNKDLKIPSQILKRGIKAIFNYLNETEVKKTIYQKVIFLGNVRAGKSSLSNTLIQGSSQLSDDRNRTVVLDEMAWTPEENLSLQVYDFGGSAWYDIVQHFFIDKHSIIFLVINLVDYTEDSYIENVEKWLQIVQARAPRAYLFIAATHIDLLSQQEVAAKKASILEIMKSREESQVENVEKEIERLKNLGNEGKTAFDRVKNSLMNRLILPTKIYSVSSKTLQNMTELKYDLLEKAKELGRVIPLSWQRLYHSLHTSDLSKSKKFLTYNDVAKLNYETTNATKAGFVHSPFITRKENQHSPETAKPKLLRTPTGTQMEYSKFKKPRKKTSEYKAPPSSAFRNPTENDEDREIGSMTRFRVQILKEDFPQLSFDKDRVHDILAFFHSIGDVLWYEGKPEIKNFVFHNQSFLIDLLKRIFSERPDELEVRGAVLMKHGLTSKTLEAARQELRTKGIMSIKYLRGLLDDLDVESKMIDAIMQLLVHFDLCYKVQDEVQENRITKLHFPWFLSDTVAQEATMMLERPPASGNWRFILEYEFPLGCPRALFESMAVRVHQVVPDHESIKHWKNGVYARIRDTKIMLYRTFDELDTITISFHVEGKVIPDLWSNLARLHREFRILMIRWPGILHEIWLVCPHCTNEGSTNPHRFQGENIERCCPENEENFTCPHAGEQGSIPGNLIFPQQASSDVPTDAELSKVAYMVGSDWKLLGRALGVDDYEIDQVNTDYDQLYEKAYQMLQQWKRERGSKAHCARLIIYLFIITVSLETPTQLTLVFS